MLTIKDFMLLSKVYTLKEILALAKKNDRKISKKVQALINKTK